MIIFVDNAGADVVLGMLPLARELLHMGAEVRRCRDERYRGHIETTQRGYREDRDQRR